MHSLFIGRRMACLLRTNRGVTPCLLYDFALVEVTARWVRFVVFGDPAILLSPCNGEFIYVPRGYVSDDAAGRLQKAGEFAEIRW